MDHDDQHFDNSTFCEYKTLADFTTEMASGPTKCSALFVHLNIVSLDKHFGDLKLFLNRFAAKVEVLCISETRLTDSKVKFYELPGYNLYYCNSNTSAGGSAIYVTDNIKRQPLSHTKIKVNGCEDVWVKLTLENNDILIVDSVCRHPNSTISDLRTFEDAFVSIIKSFTTNQKYLVLGNLNIHYDKMDTPKHIADYINHINCIGCLQLIDKPTRICTTCSSIIDHVYINATFASDVSTVILQEDVSDHLPLCVKYCCAPTIKTSQRPYIRRITQESIEPF